MTILWECRGKTTAFSIANRLPNKLAIMVTTPNLQQIKPSDVKEGIRIVAED